MSSLMFTTKLEILKRNIMSLSESKHVNLSHIELIVLNIAELMNIASNLAEQQEVFSLQNKLFAHIDQRFPSRTEIYDQVIASTGISTSSNRLARLLWFAEGIESYDLFTEESRTDLKVTLAHSSVAESDISSSAYDRYLNASPVRTSNKTLLEKGHKFGIQYVMKR